MLNKLLCKLWGHHYVLTGLEVVGHYWDWKFTGKHFHNCKHCGAKK